MNIYPRVKEVRPLADKRLLITFRNEVTKIYDCTPLLEDKVFEVLTDDSLFRCVESDRGGYGISWSEEVDLSESELWLHGTPVASLVV